ncbi:S1 RNA-binding domain-containing protein [Streptomyces macrosporus]|uniref:S1 motif domain-containing protein n=1 Tax=Streptomyces macrosporus TaxID=44032 RepID=A0ABP5XGE6_9ACTN
MTDPAPDPRLAPRFDAHRAALARGGETRTATVTDVGETEVIVELDAPVGPGLTSGSIARHELSRRPFDHPSEVVRVGQGIEVEVIGVFEGRDRVPLSARACEDRPLRAFLLGVRPGEVRTGTVAAVRNFGVFVHLDGEPPGRCTGFVNVPEPTWRHVAHPSEVVGAGQRVTAEVLASDTRRGQVALSLKALEEDPMVRFAERVGETVTGPVTKLVPFGVFVRVADGIEGLVHASDLPDGPGAVREGDRLTVRIEEVDRVRRRVGLSPADRDGPGPRP